jgi:negative regulator of sigma E activity
MKSSFFARAVSFCIAASVTLAVLGGIDQLAQPTAVGAQLAQAPVQQA